MCAITAKVPLRPVAPVHGKMLDLHSKKVTERIRATALSLLDVHPNGLRYSELQRKIKETDNDFKPNTISGCTWDLDVQYPNEVYKPSRGLFRLKKYRETNTVEQPPSLHPTDQQPPLVSPSEISPVKEEDFYCPFAEWLKNEIEDVTDAIPLGRNKFKDRWVRLMLLANASPSEVIL